MARKKRLFALDQGFPRNIVTALDAAIRKEADLVWIGDIDGRLPDFEDWEILLALHLHQRPWDGLITTDASMISLPREMSVLCQTKLSLVVADSAGHDPLKATGLLLTQLPGICAQTDPTRAQLWVLRSQQRRPSDPWEEIRKIASRRQADPARLYREAKPSDAEMRRDPLRP